MCPFIYLFSIRMLSGNWLVCWSVALSDSGVGWLVVWLLGFCRLCLLLSKFCLRYWFVGQHVFRLFFIHFLFIMLSGKWLVCWSVALSGVGRLFVWLWLFSCFIGSFICFIHLLVLLVKSGKCLVCWSVALAGVGRLFV